MRKFVGTFIATALLATIVIACTVVQATNPPSHTPEYQASPESTSTQGIEEPTNTSAIVTATSTATTAPMETPAPQATTGYANLFPSVSANGHFVVFTTNLRAILGENAPMCDTGDQRRMLCFQVVRYDIESGKFRMVSASASGETLGNQTSQNTGRAVSADGGLVVFTSFADNLIEDTVPGSHVFLSDLNADNIYSLTNPVAGNGAGFSRDASLSADGKYAVFASTAQHLGDVNTPGWNVYLYDVSARTYTLVSRGTRKPDDFGDSLKPAISPNGRWVAFWSWAGLVEGDDSPCTRTGEVPGPCGDVYRYDVQTGQLTRFKVGEGYGEGMGDLGETFISNSGRWILAGGLLIDMARNVSANLQAQLGQTTCGAVLSQSADAILYFSTDQLRLMEYDLSNGLSQPLFDLKQAGHLTDTDRSACEVDSVSRGLLSSSLENRVLTFISARGLDPKDVALCQDSTLKSYNCLDIYLWQGQGLAWIAP